MKLTKPTALLLALLLILSFSLFSCGKSEAKVEKQTDETAEEITDEDEDKTDEEESTDDTSAEETTAETAETTPGDSGEAPADGSAGEYSQDGSYSHSGSLYESSQQYSAQSGTYSSGSVTQSYTDIQCIAANGFRKVYLSFGGSSYAATVMLPNGWSLSCSGSTVTLMRDSAQIGTVSQHGSYTSGMQAVATESEAEIRSGITVQKSIMNASGAYYRRYAFSYSDNAKRSVIIETNYNEIDASTEAQLTASFMLERLRSDAALGTVPLSRSSVLILGNSFVGTSAIGTILTEMCNKAGRGVSVNAVSQGYASVPTYSNDTALLDSIRQGAYGAVFICGIYCPEDADEISPLYNACVASGTSLSIFPAYNENRDGIIKAVKNYPGTHFVNWRGEIMEIMADGVAKAALCYDDQHQHSTPLAGYIGAHMIYRAIFGAMPPSVSSNGYVEQGYINSVLGDYALTGSYYILDKNNVMLLG